MAKEKNKEAPTVPFQKETGSLAAALAEKGKAGMILLGIMVFIIWIIPIIFISGVIFPTLSYFKPSKDEGILLFGIYLLFCFAGLLVSMLISYKLSKGILGSIVPTLHAEAEAAALMPQAFGGTIYKVTGRLAVSRLPRKIANRRIQEIIDTLSRCAAGKLQLSENRLLRSNIFVTSDDRWLSIANDFHVNMKGTTPNDRELTIRILNGYWSSGTAFKYFLPILSISKEKEGKTIWDHKPDRDTVISQGIDKSVFEEANNEIKKAHESLRWIISMPIPYQVTPFKMACGVLNLDGLERAPNRDQLKSLLADTSTAAALIGVINRTTDILDGQCHRAPFSIPPNAAGIKDQRLDEFLISPNEFDPAKCPEPSEEFKNALSNIEDLEFMKKITTTSVAEYLQDQLCS